jgi:ferredoxin
MNHQSKTNEILERALKWVGIDHSYSRRQFLKLGGITLIGVSALGARTQKKMPLIIMDKAEELVIADPTKCLGCGRCELARTEFHDGKAKPSIARVKVARNLNFGPECIGCKMCLRACPWEMISFDLDTNKATKCFLCNGKPKCVEACPAGALSYVAWFDLSDKVLPRAVPASVIPPKKGATCTECHKKWKGG